MDFDCEVPGCRKTFKRKGDLTRHALLHSGVKPHTCRVCKKGFAQASALKTHLNVHSGAKPYRCLVSGCSSQFGDPSSRTRHTKETHEVQSRYRCPMMHCSAAIKRGSSFKSHLKKLHGLKPDNYRIEDYSEPMRSCRSSMKYETPSPTLSSSPPPESTLSPYRHPILPSQLSQLSQFEMGIPGSPPSVYDRHINPLSELMKTHEFRLSLIDEYPTRNTVSPGTISPLSLSPCQTPPLYISGYAHHNTPHILSASAASSPYTEGMGTPDYLDAGYAAERYQEFNSRLHCQQYQEPTAFPLPSSTLALSPIMLNAPPTTFEPTTYNVAHSPSFWPNTPGGPSEFESSFEAGGSLLFAQVDRSEPLFQRHHSSYDLGAIGRMNLGGFH